MRIGTLVLAAVLAACSGGEPASVSTLPSTTTHPVTPTTTIVPTTIAVSTTSTTTAVSLDRSQAATALRVQTDLDTLLEFGPRVSGTAPELAALEWFAASAHQITGIVPAIRSVPLPNGTVSGNVWVGPVGVGGPVLLLGAHIDSIAGSPGIDDNGSGVAILLEVLRRLTEEPPAGVRVVVVAFGAEEFVPGYDHHYGSEAAAFEMRAAGTLPDAMVSVDMVGVGDVLHSVPYFGSDPTLAGELVEIAAGQGIDLVLRPRGDISDHVPFAVAGVPSALLLRGDNPGYHTPADDHVEMDGVLEALAVVEALVASFAGP